MRKRLDRWLYAHSKLYRTKVVIPRVRRLLGFDGEVTRTPTSTDRRSAE